MKSFIVELWSRIFSALRWLSLFQIIRACIPRVMGSYAFVDAWVLGNLIVSVLLSALCSAPGLRWWELLATVYAALRVVEIIVYQANVLLFDAYRAKKAGESYAIRGFRRLVILLLHNYIEIIFWYAIIYRNLSWTFQTSVTTLDSFFEPLKMSFLTMTTFGQTRALPIGMLGELLIFLQSAIGLFMTLLILARFISLIPKPETLDELEK